MSPCSGNGTQESIVESKDDEGSIGYAGKLLNRYYFQTNCESSTPLPQFYKIKVYSVKF